LHHRFARIFHRYDFTDRILDTIESRLSNGPWGELFDQVDPNIVVLSSAALKPIEYPAGRVAFRRGIPIYGIVPSWDNLSGKGPLRVRCRRLAVWCEGMRAEAHRLYGQQLDSVDITGPPSFDSHQELLTEGDRMEFLRRAGLARDRRLITLTTVPQVNCPFGAQYVQIIARMIQEDAFGVPCQLLVRLHPQDDREAYAALPNFDHARIELPGAYRGNSSGPQALAHYNPTMDDVRHLTRTLAFSDVVVNVASTISLEACALDRPVVNLAFEPPGVTLPFRMAEYYQTTHYRPITESGATYIVSSAHELRDAIEIALRSPDRLSAERKRLYRQYDPFEDGRAAHRLASAIRGFALHSTDSAECPRVSAA
jgi:hypothetical protein